MPGALNLLLNLLAQLSPTGSQLHPRLAGFDAQQLNSAGFNADRLRDAGFDAQLLKNAGFDAQKLKDAGFDAGQLKDALPTIVFSKHAIHRVFLYGASA